MDTTEKPKMRRMRRPRMKWAPYEPKTGPIAPESEKTKRARRKLLENWEKEKLHITPKAISETIEKMHKWIADNAKHRVPIKEKIALFNQNQNAAGVSRKVQQIAMRLKLNDKSWGK